MITLMQTIVKASKVPIDTIELRTSVGRRPARTAAHNPVANVVVVGVRNLGWTCAKALGKRPSIAMR